MGGGGWVAVWGERGWGINTEGRLPRQDSYRHHTDPQQTLHSLAPARACRMRPKTASLTGSRTQGVSGEMLRQEGQFLERVAEILGSKAQTHGGERPDVKGRPRERLDLERTMVNN